MESERRDLEYFGKGLTDEQVVEKKRMLRESAQAHPEIAEYFRELCADFCVRNPQEATKQRETKEWEQLDSAFSPKKMAALQVWTPKINLSLVDGYFLKIKVTSINVLMRSLARVFRGLLVLRARQVQTHVVKATARVHCRSLNGSAQLQSAAIAAHPFAGAANRLRTIFPVFPDTHSLRPW